MIPYLQQEEEQQSKRRIWCKYHKSRIHRYKDEVSGVDIPMHKLAEDTNYYWICDDCKRQHDLRKWFYKEHTSKNYQQPRPRVFVLGKGAICKNWIYNFQRLEEWRLY